MKTIAISIFVLFLLLIIGCSRVVMLYPIEKSDIYRITKDTKIGNITAEKDGWFLSDLYLKEVVNARTK